MAARRRQTELPHAPLELLHPLTLPGAEIPGAEIMGEIAGDDAATLMELLRAVLAWSANPELKPAFDRAALERTEYTLLSRGPDAFASPAGLLAGYMAHAETASPREVAWACICISDWASERGARGTALAFAKAGALAWPRHARYAWMVARMLRAQGMMREAEAWFRRAHRIATWSDDWEAQARALNSLGNLNLSIGRLPLAKRLNLRARKIARRHALAGLVAEVTHDLFITAAEMKAFDQAEVFAGEAFQLYGRAHPRLNMLMHDVAQCWVEQGLYARALPVLTALVRRFNEPAERIRAVAAATHAAGALRLREAFERCWAEFWEAANAVAGSPILATTLFEAGLGAAGIEQWDRATSVLELAREYADAFGIHDISIRAESALTRVHARRSVEKSQPRIAGESGDVLARGFLTSLDAAEPATV